MVDRIPDSSNPFRVQPDKTHQTDELNRVEKPGGTESISPQQSESDVSRFSVDAAEVARYQELARLHLEAYADVEDTQRQEKLNLIKQRVQEGYYDQPEVVDALTDSLVTRTLEEAGTADNLDAVRGRVDQNYYDRPKVIEKTAEKMTRAVLPNQAPPEEE